MSALLIDIPGLAVLKAGHCTEIADSGREARVVDTAVPPLFDQLVTALEQADEGGPLPVLTPPEVGVALTALAFRWGSYLAVPLRDGPLPAVKATGGAASLSPSESVRIEEDAGYALEALVRLYRTDRHRFNRLAALALVHLPVTRKQASPAAADARSAHAIRSLSTPALRGAVALQASDAREVAGAREDCRLFGDRVLANSLVRGCWSTGPIRTHVHECEVDGLSLDRRRIGVRDEKKLMAWTSDLMAHAAWALLGLYDLPDADPVEERLLPYRLAGQVDQTRCAAGDGLPLVGAGRSFVVPGATPAAGPKKRGRRG
jgi:hypothetical protein